MPKTQLNFIFNQLYNNVNFHSLIHRIEFSQKNIYKTFSFIMKYFIMKYFIIKYFIIKYFIIKYFVIKTKSQKKSMNVFLEIKQNCLLQSNLPLGGATYSSDSYILRAYCVG